MKVRLVAYRDKFTNSGVEVQSGGSTYPVSASPTTISVAFATATNPLDVFVPNQTLYDSTGNVYGVVQSVPNSTSIILQSVEIAIPDETIFYYFAETQFELDLS